MEKVVVKVGQVWQDYDVRFRLGAQRRLIKVLEIKGGKARVQNHSGSGPRTWIRLDRFQPTASGYKFVSEDGAGL